MLRLVGVQWIRAACLIGVAALWEQYGQPEQAAQLLGTAEPFLNTASHPVESILVHTEYDRTVAAVRSALSKEAFEAAYAKGQEMTLEQAIEFALAR